MKKHVLTFLTFLMIQNIFAETSFLENDIPIDQNVMIKKLDNGLQYYIKKNEKPKARAELRLVVNAGSVLEDDAQQGLAHFVEHMAFNGTRDFAKHELVDYLETIGMKFGPEVNAYTSFDETVYMLQLPTDSMDMVDTGMKILQNWASYVTFEPEEIDKERGVIIEEWRSGRGAQARMRDKQLPVLFHQSKYAQRLPIGKKEILESFEHEELTRFYRDWYRPDLMAVVAVGDFDPDVIEAMIIKYFSVLENPELPSERIMFKVPDHDSTLFAIASDPEATRTGISVYYKHDPEEVKTVADYRKSLTQAIYNAMLNERLSELLRTQNPPFLYGYSAKGQIIRTKDVYVLSAGVKEDGLESGLAALLTEAKRVDEHGFTIGELERQKLDFLRSIERAFNERDKTESSRYAAEFIRNFLEQEPIPGIEFEYKLYNVLIPSITLQDVNVLAQKWIRDESRVFFVNAPEKENVTLPGEEELLQIFQDIAALKVEPYQDNVSDKKLLETLPQSGSIVDSFYIEPLDVWKWQLSNGVEVLLKKTDYKNDQVLFTAFSPGGNSLVTEEDYIAALTSTSVVSEGGLGSFTKIELDKKLAGKVVSVSPNIQELSEGLSGSASPKDLETMFKLIHLTFTSPRADSVTFQAFQQRMWGFIQNRGANPDAVYSDSIQTTMAQYHPRSKPWSADLLAEMDLETSLQIYRDRFADASDFTFIIVGNFEYAAMRSYVSTFLASLPGIDRNEKWADLDIDPPTGIINKVIKMGIEPKSKVTTIFSGLFDWSTKTRYDFQSMLSVLKIRLREVIREDKSGTYGVSVSGSTSHYPEERYEISIQFSADPDRIDELYETILKEIAVLSEGPIEETYVTKVTENQKRQREVGLKQNGYWISNLRLYSWHDMDPLGILSFEDFVDNLSARDIQNAFKKYFTGENSAKFVLLPQEPASVIEGEK